MAQLDKSSGAYLRNLPPEGKPETDVTPGRVQPAAAPAPGAAK